MIEHIPEITPLFSDDMDSVLRDTSARLTTDVLRGTFNANRFYGDIKDVQRTVIMKLGLKGKKIPNRDGSPTPVEAFSPDAFLATLPHLGHLGLDIHDISPILEDSFYDVLAKTDFIQDALSSQHEAFTRQALKAGLLKNEEPYLLISGFVSYKHMPSHALVSVAGTVDLVSALERKNPNALTRIWRTNNTSPFLQADVYRNDNQSGKIVSIIPQSWFQKGFKDKHVAASIQTVMDFDPAVRHTVYEAVPELYQGKEPARALRDYVIDRLLNPGTERIPEDKLRDFAKDVLSFQPGAFQVFCQTDSQHPDRLSFASYQERVHEYMIRMERGELARRPYRQKDLNALTRLFASHKQKNFGEIGNVVEAIAQEKGRMKTLNHLAESQQEADLSRQTGR